MNREGICTDSMLSSLFEWAKSYDSGGAEIRSKARHDQWQKKLSCRVLHLDGEAEIDEKFKKVSEALGLFEKRT